MSDDKSQSRIRDPFRDRPADLRREPPGAPPRARPGRRFENGVGAILVIDLLALLLVAASAPAAYLWLGQSHPSPIAVATEAPLASPSPAPDAS